MESTKFGEPARQQGVGLRTKLNNGEKLSREEKWKIYRKLPQKTKVILPPENIQKYPLKSLDRWGYYYFSLFTSVCSHLTYAFSG